MVDLATLGLAVDSSQVRAATADLDKFSKSGKTAQQQAEAMVQTMSKGKPGTQEFAKGFQEADKQQKNFSSSTQKVIDGLNNQFVRMNTTEKQWRIIQNVQKAGVDLNSSTGKSISQMTGALYDMEQAQNKAEKSSSNLANTLTRRFLVGFIVSQIRNVTSSIIGLNAELAKAGDVGRITGAGSQGIQGLQTAAGNRGIDANAFLDAMVEFNRQVDIAKHGTGDLNALFRLNGVAVKDTSDAFFKVADLVRNAATEAQKFSILQQAGLPATLEMVRLMEQGGDAIKRQREEATKLTDDQLRRAREIEDRFNQMWTAFVRGGKAAIVDVFEFQKETWSRPLGADGTLVGWMVKQFGGTPPPAVSPASRIDDRFPSATDALKQGRPGPPTVDPSLVKRQIGMDVGALSAWGELATVQQRVEIATKTLTAAQIDNSKITNEQIKAVGELTRIQAEGAQVQARVTLGVSNAEELRTQKLHDLQILIKNGTITLDQATVAQRAYERSIRDTVDQMEVLKSALPGLKTLELESSRGAAETKHLLDGVQALTL